MVLKQLKPSTQNGVMHLKLHIKMADNILSEMVYYIWNVNTNQPTQCKSSSIKKKKKKNKLNSS